mgnify:CR=1 FL=1|tara:strand:- start:1840 stop:2655 length:816 start_codon:yes stop_codon:yes gene_type:complete
MLNKMEELQSIAKNIRKSILKMTLYSKSSHIGAALSIVEILTLLYFHILKIDPKIPGKPDRDIFILSKAHGSAALYSILAEKGFFSKSLLEKYYVDEGVLPGHVDKDSVPGIEFSAGSLGHGFPVAVGMAIANNTSENKRKIYTIIGDGESNEGSVWEASMLASHLKLNNLTVVLDYNKIQSFGRTNEVINQEPIGDRWKSFGWEVLEVDGHDYGKLITAFEKKTDKPKIIIAHTIKGKGISFMEDKLEWHYKSPDSEQYKQAIEELDREN